MYVHDYLFFLLLTQLVEETLINYFISSDHSSYALCTPHPFSHHCAIPLLCLSWAASWFYRYHINKHFNAWLQILVIFFAPHLLLSPSSFLALYLMPVTVSQQIPDFFPFRANCLLSSIVLPFPTSAQLISFKPVCSSRTRDRQPLNCLLWISWNQMRYMTKIWIE